MQLRMRRTFKKQDERVPLDSFTFVHVDVVGISLADFQILVKFSLDHRRFQRPTSIDIEHATIALLAMWQLRMHAAIMQRVCIQHRIGASLRAGQA